MRFIYRAHLFIGVNNLENTLDIHIESAAPDFVQSVRNPLDGDMSIHAKYNKMITKDIPISCNNVNITSDKRFKMCIAMPFYRYGCIYKLESFLDAEF